MGIIGHGNICFGFSNDPMSSVSSFQLLGPLLATGYDNSEAAAVSDQSITTYNCCGVTADSTGKLRLVNNISLLFTLEWTQLIALTVLESLLIISFYTA